MARDSWAETLFQIFSIGDGGVEFSRNTCSPQPANDERNEVRFVCISDTHGMHEQLRPLPPGDVLVHTGDFTNFGRLDEVQDFARWLAKQPYHTKLVVPGNHDMILHEEYYRDYWSDWAWKYATTSEALGCFKAAGAQVLIDDTVVVEGVHVFGSPWVRQSTPWRTAFNKTSHEMKSHWDAHLPAGIDVLLTHMPPWGIGDRDEDGTRLGCPHLALAVAERVHPQVHVFGHVHSDTGFHVKEDIAYLNAASVCDFYMVGGRRSFTFSVIPRPRSSD